MKKMTLFVGILVMVLVFGMTVVGCDDDTSTITSIPDIPGGVWADGGAFDVILVYWSRVHGADGYRIYRSTSENGEYLYRGNRGNSGSLTYSDWGVTPGVTYYYKVSAYNKAGESAMSPIPGSATAL